MTPYKAMMKAADFIEGNPGRYRFSGREVPDGEGSDPACMWGWTGYFLGMPKGSLNFKVAETVGDRCTASLYCFGGIGSEESLHPPSNAARQLRAYAKHRFANEAGFDPAYLAFKDSLTEEPSHAPG